MPAYYNEFDRAKAAWLRELIRCDLIASGEVDERSIEAVAPADLRGFDQCHFFAGIGVWSYALRNAGWADDARVWTGSCPCPSFSASGQRLGFDDPRHLWPAWFRLIGECRPDLIFGEQVASDDGLAWLDVVSADLEGTSYAIGSADLCAAGIGAPHIRQRLYWVADSAEARREGRQDRGTDSGDALSNGCGSQEPERSGASGPLVDTERGRGGRGAGHKGREKRAAPCDGQDERSGLVQAGHSGAPSLMGNANGGRCQEPNVPVRPARQEQAATLERGTTFWSAADWIPCADGKHRPVEPGTFPLAHGAPARVVRLRGYGDGIVAPLATAFIEAYLDIRGAA